MPGPGKRRFHGCPGCRPEHICSYLCSTVPAEVSFVAACEPFRMPITLTSGYLHGYTCRCRVYQQSTNRLWYNVSSLPTPFACTHCANARRRGSHAYIVPTLDIVVYREPIVSSPNNHALQLNLTVCQQPRSSIEPNSLERSLKTECLFFFWRV
jgi:hypothetical protein